ncbi:hypothetical protein MSMAL_2534 [Methanosarcina mazei LYC]|uniref:Dockerin domain-containing protein n=1 Tax=Methanosarcina mazei LYC TaxID=1434114 RepID=A0A0E3RP68_METMZ|nr:hypothetical protein MSMAL_2534 [Methanosarcina mazei LYC]
MSNSKFEYISSLKLYNMENIEIHNITMTNCSGWLEIRNGNNSIVHDIQIENSYNSLNSYNLNNFTFYNISVKNIETGDLKFSETNYCTFYNICVDGIGNYLKPGSGGGLYWYNSHHNTGHNFYINNTGWSSFAPGNNYGNWSDIVIYNSGHNGIDLHSIKNTVINNVSIYDSVSNNILLTAGLADSPSTENITITNIYSKNSGIVAQQNVSDIFIANVCQDGQRDGMGISAKNVTIINATFYSNNSDSLVTLHKLDRFDCENISIIDTSFYMLNAISGTSNKLINSKYQKVYYQNHTSYYYPEIKIKLSNGNTTTGTIVFQNEVNPLVSSLNGFGDNESIFNTTLLGVTFSPVEDRLNSPVLADCYQNSKGIIQNYLYKADITTSDKNISLKEIDPDSSWYRKDPNIPTYTITAIIPNASSKGPDIIGFAPSRENPFNPGEKKNFRVWTDEPLTSMEWLVNGSSVLKGSLNYTWTVTDRNTTIEFIGSNANGPVNHKWDLGESSNETSGNDSIDDEIPEQEVIFSPADSMITLNVSEKTVFSISPDIFTTKEWYINGYPIQNNTTSMTRCWSTAGTHDVTFKGAGSGEPVSHTWTVNVIEEKKNDEESTESIISITPEYQIVTPKQSFGLDITVDPSTPITGTQLDFTFNSSMASANSVIEGNLFKQKGASTFFNEGDINSSEGTIKHIYGLIIGTSNVSSSGTFATVNLTAGNKTGMTEFSLSNVLISDINSKSVPYTVTNATVLIDTAPVIDPICCPKSVDEKSKLAFKISAKDADGDRLTLSASGLPEGASFNRTSGAFAWTPAVGQTGVYTIAFKVSDGYLTDSENVTVTVNKLNNPPVIDFFEPINGSSFSEGERIGISVNATDAEKQALNYSIKIDGVMYSSDPAYIWETDYSSSGNHTIEVSVSDGIDEAKMQHSIYISECHPRYDVNEDGVVNILDITNVSREYETTVSKPYPRYDTNQDGEINILDLTLVGHHFGEKVE